MTIKLYHATDISNKDNILECGLHSGMLSKHNKEIQEEGVYGFTELKHALGFARDQCWDGVAVFSFYAENPIIDPEYADADEDMDYGTAYFYQTEDAVDVSLEYDSEVE